MVTTLPPAVLLPRLRKALVSQLSAVPDGLLDLQSKVRGCLERVSIARVFDIEGLWEVLGELEDARVGQKPGDPFPKGEAEGKPQEQQRTEVQDSEDEGGLSSPEPPSTQKPSTPPDAPQHSNTTNPEPAPSSTLPDMVLITHTSALLNALFTSRDKEAAHNTMLLLSSHLHALTRAPSGDGPLIMFLNSTTSSDLSSTATAPSRNWPHPKHPESTLRSIFNPLAPPPPPPPDPAAAEPAPPYPPTVPGPHAGQAPGSNPVSATRNKPSFGQVFAHLLDLHLLCTRVPRTSADRAALTEAAASVAGVADVSYVWVVEVLLDEVGVYERGSVDGRWDWGRRRSREQRWGAVDVEGDGDGEERVVGAFIG